MERLTHERVNGIKTGYWSSSKKQDLVDRLSEYEDTGLTPDEINEMRERDTAKAPEKLSGYWLKCPSCGLHIGRMEDNFCPECGQRLKRED